MDGFLQFIAWLNASGFSTPFLVMIVLSALIALCTDTLIRRIVGISAIFGIIFQALLGWGIVVYGIFAVLCLMALGDGEGEKEEDAG